jgi:hypothetical protein
MNSVLLKLAKLNIDLTKLDRSVGGALQKALEGKGNEIYSMNIDNIYDFFKKLLDDPKVYVSEAKKQKYMTGADKYKEQNNKKGLVSLLYDIILAASGNSVVSAIAKIILKKADSLKK